LLTITRLFDMILIQFMNIFCQYLFFIWILFFSQTRGRFIQNANGKIVRDIKFFCLNFYCVISNKFFMDY
jgi:hypothetical protein